MHIQEVGQLWKRMEQLGERLEKLGAIDGNMGKHDGKNDNMMKTWGNTEVCEQLGYSDGNMMDTSWKLGVKRIVIAPSMEVSPTWAIHQLL